MGMLNLNNIEEPGPPLLNDLEMSDLLQFAHTMSECKEKDLLSKALIELTQYRALGAVEELQCMKEWMDVSINDLRRGTFSCVKGMREVVESYRNPPKRRRGRPRRGEL